MLGLSLGAAQPQCGRLPLSLPAGFGWDSGRFPLSPVQSGAVFRSNLTPRDLVSAAIWSGAAIHVDGEAGDDANSGIGASDGDFSVAKRTIHAAFVAGNATGAAYRVNVKPGQYEESAFTRNGNDEPDQPVAIIGWGGAVHYRTGPHVVTWTPAGGSYSAPVSSVKRAFRTDLLTAEGQYTELAAAADLATCQATPGTWFDDSGTVHVNIGTEPGATDIALIRSFHGARFLTHDRDLYLGNIHCEGGISGALHVDAVATRNVVAVGCSFRYAAPSNPAAPLDAARVRRTDGLVAFFDCDASMGAKDGFSFHEDGTPGMHVLLENCTAHHNGIDPATSCNAVTTHDGVRAIVLGGDFGQSRNGTEVHMIQSTQSWIVGARAVARDIDGSSTAFKCSNASVMWLERTVADAAGAASNLGIEANAGTVYTRGHRTLSGTTAVSSGGSISGF